MSRPDWKDAPEWANWVAQDGDGEWWWFQNKPTLYHNDVWRADGGKSFRATPFPKATASLEPRP